MIQEPLSEKIEAGKPKKDHFQDAKAQSRRLQVEGTSLGLDLGAGVF
jgi:hypothetical protein